MNKENIIKATITSVVGFLTSMFGTLTIPLVLLLGSNLVDYFSGIMATTVRGQKINSARGLEGIAKKVCMWLLVIVGAMVDSLATYAVDLVGYDISINHFFACVVALWIVCNELISILENITDMGVAVPGFLKPLVEKIKSQVESNVPGDIEKK